MNYRISMSLAIHVVVLNACDAELQRKAHIISSRFSGQKIEIDGLVRAPNRDLQKDLFALGEGEEAI